jgi:hypothetical protein
MAALLRKHKSIRSTFFSTRTKSDVRQLEQRRLLIEPTALYCYSVGRNITSQLDPRHMLAGIELDEGLDEEFEETDEEVIDDG